MTDDLTQGAIPHARRTTKAHLVLALVFSLAGILHFVMPAMYEHIVPPWLPNPPLLVLVSGVCELLGAIGVLLAATRRAAGWGLLALLVAVFPANVYMLQAARLDGASAWWQLALFLRLPLQPLMMRWVWLVAVRDRTTMRARQSGRSDSSTVQAPPP